jgi:hypothetical protein
LGFLNPPLTWPGSLDEAVQDGESEVVIVLTSSVEFHGVNCLDRPRHGLQILSWELGGLDLADVCLQPVKAINGGATNELDEAKVQDRKVVTTIEPIHSEIISQSWFKAVLEELTSLMVVGLVIFVLFHNNQQDLFGSGGYTEPSVFVCD